MNHIKQTVFIIVVILILIVAIGGQVSINQMKEEQQKLSEKLEELEYENEKLKYELDNPDKEKMANEQGYNDPSAEYYYSD